MQIEGIQSNHEESKVVTIEIQQPRKGYIADIKAETKGLSIKQIRKVIFAELSEGQTNSIPETLLIGGLSTLSINEEEIGIIRFINS